MKPWDVLGSSNGPQESWIWVGSSADQVGQFCVQVVDRLLTRRLNLVSGSTVGSFCASSSLQFHFRGTVGLDQSSAADQSHLFSLWPRSW